MSKTQRIGEVNEMCSRKNPIYEQVSNFSIALYALDYFNAPDLMSIDDLDTTAAAEILKENFEKIDEKEIPVGYDISGSDERFLLVIGGPDFPDHFAAVADTKSRQPFFSKLDFMGSGFDSLEELKDEFCLNGKKTNPDINYFRRI